MTLLSLKDLQLSNPNAVVEYLNLKAVEAQGKYDATTLDMENEALAFEIASFLIRDATIEVLTKFIKTNAFQLVFGLRKSDYEKMFEIPLIYTDMYGQTREINSHNLETEYNITDASPYLWFCIVQEKYMDKIKSVREIVKS